MNSRRLRETLSTFFTLAAIVVTAVGWAFL